MKKIFIVLVGMTISLPSVFAATELTVTSATAQDKVYDGLTNAVISMANATTNGVISGDDVQVSNLVGWFATPGVGTNIPVTAALTLTGTDKDNYSLTQPTGLAAAITRKTLTASLVPTIGKVYDGNTGATLGATNYTFSGLISGETCAVNQTTGTYADKNVGTGIVVTATLASTSFADYGSSGFLTNNYVLPGSATSAVGKITRKTMTAGLVPTISKVYDGNTGATVGPTNYTFSGLISGETCTVNQTTGVYDSKNVGTGIVVTTTLASTNFADYGSSGFLTNNYALPGSATGAVGEITKKSLRFTVQP